MSHNSNLYAHFRSTFEGQLDTQLLCADDGRTFTYRDADDVSGRLANALHEHGAQPGDRITVQVEKSSENLFLYLACLRSGYVYHPLNTAYTASELAYFLGDAEPSIVVGSAQSQPVLESALPTDCRAQMLTMEGDGSGSLMDAARSASSEAPTVASKGEDLAALLYSSGTTGRPKGIMLTHDNLRSNAQTLVSAWGFTAQDRLLHALPIYHVHGLFVALGCVFMSGASMVWHRRFSDHEVIAALPDCTVMMGVPTYYTRLLSNPEFDAGCCQNMRLFVSGSAPLLSETFIDFEERTGHRILERYGMTETGMNTSNPLLPESGARKPGTVGRPLPGVSARIVDDEGHPVADGDTGNLQVKGENVFAGYWRMPEKTAEDFSSDGFFDTGDKACIDSDGYVAIVGRAKDMIITGGLNVYPKEVELVIDEMAGVKESAVIGLPDSDFGEAVVAVIVPGGEPPSAEEVVAACRATLANFKVPKRVEVLATLPRNAMGKVQKNVLREQFSVGDHP
ncbi:MAG: AMP-binding protein [Pseudomonadaceae bacterium]|nr:AMP-binding protein [Pseudomonadaceae bacterium]